MNSHKKEVDEKLKYRCNQCSMEFSRITSLASHKQSVHMGLSLHAVYVIYNLPLKPISLHI